MASLSLSQLLDVAIGTPETGAVNFTALHSLLQAVLRHLGLQDLPAQVEENQHGKVRSGLEEGDRTKAEAKDLLQGTASSPQVTSMADDVRQMKKMIKENKSSISKAMALSQDLLGEISRVKSAQSRMEKDIRMIQDALGLGNVQDAGVRLPGLFDQSALDSDVEGAGGHLVPTKPPASDVDTPHAARSALGLKEAETKPVPMTSKGTSKGTPATQPGSLGTQAVMQREQVTPEKWAGTPTDQTKTSDASATTPGTQPEAPGTQATTPGTQPEAPGTQTTTPGMQPAPPGTQRGEARVQPSPPSMELSLPGTEKVPDEATSGALGTQMAAKEGGKALPSTQLAQAGHPVVEALSPTAQELELSLDTDASASIGGVTVEALRQIEQLGHLYTTLKEQVSKLEAIKSDHTEAEKLRQLFLEGDQESITSVRADLRGCKSSLQDLARDLQDEKGKIRQLEDALGKLEVAGAGGSNQITLQLGATLQEIRQELKELGDQQLMTKATLEELVTRTSEQLQEQLDKLRVMVESTGQEQAEGQAECPVCCTDVSAQVGQLLQRYEKLQELVDSLMSQQPVGKVVRQLPARSQDAEQLKRIQATIVHLQGDYEKLSSVTGNLMDDRHQKQKDIEALFQSLERLEKKKADKEDLLLGIDVKADKTALASKVSHTQFDASMERLNEVIQEMLSRAMDQEQGWHQVQQQLSKEMDSKLDRLELGPFRQQLEEHWKNILEKLPGMTADDAAGIKKQLLAPFHCVSCDRPLNMLVPGPDMVTIPSMPPLPCCLAKDPNAILKQEQMQEHVHREQVASGRYPSVPRHCGGQHTLTRPLRRFQRLQSFPPSNPQSLQPPTPLLIKHKTELLGQDGHIYRGQQDGQLPVLLGKEGFPRDKSKLSPRQRHTQDTGRLLSRPQTARPLISQPGAPTSLEHRPASSRSRISEASRLLLTLQDGSSTPAGPPPPQPPSRRASGSGQQQ